MQLTSNPLVYYLIDRWRGNVASLSCDGFRISINGSSAAPIPLLKLNDAPSITPGWAGDELSVLLRPEMRRIRIRSKNRRGVRDLAKKLETGWREAATAQINPHRDEINHILRGIKDLDSPTRYPAACILRPLLAKAKFLEANLFTQRPLAPDVLFDRIIELAAQTDGNATAFTVYTALSTAIRGHEACIRLALRHLV